MTILAGRVLRAGEGFVQGWVEHDGTRVVAHGDGEPSIDADVAGFAMPAPLNAHTHVGDRALRGRIDARGRTLAEVVAPPDGLKHRALRETPRAALVAGMRDAIAELDAAGSRSFLDFREQGIAGVDALREAIAGSDARATILGRGEGDDAIRAVLDAADGIGFSGLADAPPGVPERAAHAAHARGKPFAIHFSEAQREDAARALALRPAFLVHAVHATRADLDAIAKGRVPIVLCPRSNALFGARADLPAMVEAGVPLALGSDNAMFQTLDVIDEARAAHASFRQVPRHVLLDALVGAPVRAPGDHDWIVLDGDPLDARKPSVIWRSW